MHFIRPPTGAMADGVGRCTERLFVECRPIALKH